MVQSQLDSDIADVNKKFPLYTFTGTNKELGEQIGSILKDRIISTLDFYKTTFARPEEEVFKYAKIFRKSISIFSKDYASEIESMADVVDIDPLWLYALNARSEIMNKFENECTASFFSYNKLLGQNWDWAKELEDLSYIARLQQDSKPDILQIAEPGILGKIGFNSEGLGVCLNFLHFEGYDPTGVPTHVLLRGILDCRTIEEAKRLVTKHSIGRTSNVLVADKFGNYFDAEFAGDKFYLSEGKDQNYVHTNHYLVEKINPETEKFASSYTRFKRATELVNNYGKQANLGNFKNLLLDKSNDELPICRRYVKPVNSLLQNSGTVCSLIMDLQKLTMHLTKGNPYENSFEEISLKN